MKAFRDKYTDFSFNEISSRSMKVWITNSLDIQFNMSPSFSDSYVEPMFSNTRYLEGTSATSMALPTLKCIAIDVTMNEWRAISEWLSPHKKGRLRFSFNNGTHYWAKPSTAPTGITYIHDERANLSGDVYKISFNITFATFGDYAAQGDTNIAELNRVNRFQVDEPTMADTLTAHSNNSYYFPLLYNLDIREVLNDNNESFDPKQYTSTTYAIYNTGAYDAYPNLQLKLNTGFQLLINNKPLYKYELSTLRAIEHLEVHGSKGLVVYNGRLVESTFDINGLAILASSQNYGPFTVPTGQPEMHYAKIVDDSDGALTLQLASPLKYHRYGTNFAFTVFRGLKYSNGYGEGAYPIVEDGAPYPMRVKDQVFYPFGDASIEFIGERTVKIRADLPLLDVDGTTLLDINGDPLLDADDNQAYRVGDAIYSVGDFCYLSLCNASVMRLEQIGSNGTPIEGFFIMNTRGAI